jgi:hypothetical protein
MEARIRYCNYCGERFVITSPTQGHRLYCCKVCQQEHHKEKWRDYNRNRYIPVKPYPITCKKCGKPFLGKWGAKYCVECLENGNHYFRQLLSQRTVNVE